MLNTGRQAMERYTPEDREILVAIFLRNNSSVTLAQREFRRTFPGRPTPTGQTLRRLAARFKETGSMLDKKGTGRPRSARSEANIAAVAADIAEDPSMSTRRRATQLAITRSSLQRILVEELKILPQKTKQGAPSKSKKEKTLFKVKVVKSKKKSKEVKDKLKKIKEAASQET